MDNMPHYSTEQLIDFLEGRLDELSSAELSKHLESGCQVCNDSAAFYKRMFSAVQTLHWKSPSHAAHRKVIQAYSAKYPVKTKHSWRSLLRPALIGFTVLALVTFAFLFNLSPLVVHAGYIESVTGQVEILDPSAEAWSVVSPGQSVPVDASPRSFSGSQATIAFPGGEKTILGSESEVHLVSLSESQGSWKISLEQTSGQTENQTSINTKSFSVRTVAGIANSRSGHFVMNIKADGSVVTNVLEGEVETLSHNERTILQAGETSIMPFEKLPDVTPTFEESLIGLLPNLTPVPTQTITPTFVPTITPSLTPTPTGFYPTPINTPEGSIPTSDSNNVDISCPPGNSGGAGKSEDASNSEKACK